MAIVAHLVEKTKADGQNDVRDGIRAVIVAINDGVDTTNALIQARAVTVCQAAGLNIPSGYFDTNRSVEATFDAASDNAIFKAEKLAETVAS